VKKEEVSVNFAIVQGQSTTESVMRLWLLCLPFFLKVPSLLMPFDTKNPAMEERLFVCCVLQVGSAHITQLLCPTTILSFHV